MAYVYKENSVEFESNEGDILEFSSYFYTSFSQLQLSQYASRKWKSFAYLRLHKIKKTTRVWLAVERMSVFGDRKQS